MTAEQRKRFHELVVKYALNKISQEEIDEMESLEVLRHKACEKRLDKQVPGWRERESEWRARVEKLIKELY